MLSDFSVCALVGLLQIANKKVAMNIKEILSFNIILVIVISLYRRRVAHNVHALAMAGQFITFCPNVCPVNEQKVEIFILLFNREFSAGNYSPTANKKLITCSSAQLSPMRLLPAVLFVSQP